MTSRVVRVSSYQSTSSGHGSLLSLPFVHVILVIKQLKLHMFLCRFLRMEGIMEMGSRQGPGVLPFLAMQGVCLLASQKIRYVLVPMMILASRQSREVGLAGDFSIRGPLGR